jgi:DNA-binding response OmpR family regulator
MAKILIVEDEALIGMALEAAVSEAGHSTIGPFGGADAALEAISAAPVDAAILDVNLGRGGWSYPVAAELARRAVPFVFLTGYGIERIDPAFHGAQVVRKPFDDRRLRAVIASLAQAPGEAK